MHIIKNITDETYKIYGVVQLKHIYVKNIYGFNGLINIYVNKYIRGQLYAYLLINVFFTIGPQNGDLGALLPPN